MNNLGKENPRSLAYAKFKMKQRNIFGLALVDSGNVVHSSIVSADFWEAIGGNYDCKCMTINVLLFFYYKGWFIV